MEVDWTQLLALLKQYGPVVAVLLVVIYWQARQINKLLDRNSSIYEAHIKSLWETQQWLMTKLIGPQPSSQASPTVQEIKTDLGRGGTGKESEKKGGS